MLRIAMLVCVFLALLPSVQAQEGETVVVLTHDSFAISESTLQAFEDESGYEVQILRSGDAGQMVNQAILSKANPLGDVLYGVDNTFLSRALDAEIFVEYAPEALESLQPDFLPVPGLPVTPIDYGDVCLNADSAWFAEQELELPASLQSLAGEDYRGQLVVQNPATSSPGLAFLLTTIAQFGDGSDDIVPQSEDHDDYLAYWKALRENDVLVVDGWSDAYYSEFTVGSRGLGTRPLVLSYASSPPAEVLYGEDPDGPAPTSAIVDDGMCFRQVEYAAILQGAANPSGAEQFIDFMLSETFQADLPLNMFVFPVRADITLPEVFAEHAQLPQVPAALDPALIEQHREEWIQAWLEVMLQ